MKDQTTIVGTTELYMQLYHPKVNDWWIQVKITRKLIIQLFPLFSTMHNKKPISFD